MDLIYGNYFVLKRREKLLFGNKFWDKKILAVYQRLLLGPASTILFKKKLGLSDAFANVLPLRRRIETFNDYLSLVMQEGGLVNKKSWVRFLFLIILFTRTCRSIFNASLESEKELNGRKPLLCCLEKKPNI